MDGEIIFLELLRRLKEYAILREGYCQNDILGNSDLGIELNVIIDIGNMITEIAKERRDYMEKHYHKGFSLN